MGAKELPFPLSVRFGCAERWARSRPAGFLARRRVVLTVILVDTDGLLIEEPERVGPRARRRGPSGGVSPAVPLPERGVLGGIGHFDGFCRRAS